MELTLEDFSLRETLECGQVFRWKKNHGAYYGTIRNTAVKIEQYRNKLLFETFPRGREHLIEDYFRLDDDFDEILDSLKQDPVLWPALKQHLGLRLVRQEPFECLISFITSAASNIPRINQCLNSIAQAFGEPIGDLDGIILYSFPTPEMLSQVGEEELNVCNLGYRAKHIHQASQIITDSELSMIRKMPYERAKKMLMELPGVGPKVADCVLLFSMDKLEAFPVDVWIKRIMEELYFEGRKTTESKIREFAMEHFGQYAGYAQQYLYHYHRTTSSP